MSRFVCRDVHADDAVLASGPFLLRPAEWIESMRNPHISKSHRLERAVDLCLRQSAGDSTRPQIDVSFCRGVQLRSEDDVSNL